MSFKMVGLFGYLLVVLFLPVNAQDVCKMCVCSSSTVNCIGLNLTYIPSLPPNTTVFNFIGNNIPSVSRDTFKNISSSKIYRLRLKANKIKHFDKDTLKDLKFLQSFGVSNNSLTLKSVHNIVYASRIGKFKNLLLEHIGLTNIPPDLFHGALPSFLKHLDLSNNQITVLNFTNLLTLEKLEIFEIRNNKLHTVISDYETSRKLRHLHQLDFSYNNLSINSVHNVLYTCNIGRINTLYLINIGLSNIKSDIFQGPLSSFLKVLDLSSNLMDVLNFTTFKSLERLRFLKVENNKLRTVIPDEVLNLESLSLNANSLRDLPNFCDGRTPFFPKLSQVSLQNNSIGEYQSENVNCLKKLMRLDLSINSISIMRTNSFSSLPALSTLLFSQQRSSRTMTLERYAFKNSNLKHLFLDRNNILLEHVDNLALEGCPNLLELYMAYCNLRGYEEDFGKINVVLSPLTNLTILNLQFTFLNIIPSVIKTFLNLQHLELKGNFITSLPDGAFNSNRHLIYLDLGFNKIKTITHKTFSAETRNMLQTIGLEDNPFVCNCDLVWFIQWLNEHHKKFINYPNKYKCLNITERICLNNIPAFQLTIGVCCILVSILLIISIVYKYRWTMKYQIYIWRHQPKHLQHLAERQCQYDVFVSYSAHDSNWVFDHLAPFLEGEEGLKLCIHERDFVGGKLIIDNIVDAIEDSRYVLIVLSNNFARSEWCKQEMIIAHDHVLKHLLQPLVVVLLEDINNEYMSKSLNVLLNTTTYLSWCEDPNIVAKFWTNLKRSFRNVY